MASMIQFTNNYRDCSTEAGYQFEFYCDGCGTGCMSPFKASKLGAAAGIMRAASSFFGGMGGASNVADQSKDFLRGKERDEAIREAVVEAKKQFKLCGRCGKWVCELACWNPKRNMCEACAPDLEEELASAQDKARVMWMQRKAMSEDMISDIDITQDGGKPKALAAKCTACGAELTGKFCGQCGAAAPAADAKKFCANCGNEASGTAKFCGTCGNKL
ncbi:hypothetical protein PHYC_02454 [Phycisphaerales bacterium]|nr:hypothetical protein PHYC_02454 [Phycisphaerales bacterium]